MSSVEEVFATPRAMLEAVASAALIEDLGSEQQAYEKWLDDVDYQGPWPQIPWEDLSSETRATWRKKLQGASIRSTGTACRYPQFHPLAFSPNIYFNQICSRQSPQQSPASPLVRRSTQPTANENGTPPPMVTQRLRTDPSAPSARASKKAYPAEAGRRALNARERDTRRASARIMFLGRGTRVGGGWDRTEARDHISGHG